MTCLLLAFPALAAINVSSSVVKSGFFLAPDCKPTADPKAFNECVCEAHINKAQITGLAPEINASVNAGLALLPEKLAAESCEGAATGAPAAGLKVNLASADYEIAYQSPTTLTVLITYSTYGAGAERALEGTEGFTFDLASGTLVDPISHLKPEQVAKADNFIKHELLKKYPIALTDEAKARAEPYLSENGCDLCTMFYAKDGWVVRFQIDSIAPYLIGEPEVVIPADIMAAPETLMTQTKS
ncbi:MAG: RsiV family protein [Rickettsiales bacterium]|nr:RsiV family protein [Rickettsiales bacterium]